MDGRASKEELEGKQICAWFLPLRRASCMLPLLYAHERCGSLFVPCKSFGPFPRSCLSLRRFEVQRTAELLLLCPDFPDMPALRCGNEPWLCESVCVRLSPLLALTSVCCTVYIDVNAGHFAVYALRFHLQPKRALRFHSSTFRWEAFITRCSARLLTAEWQ